MRFVALLSVILVLFVSLAPLAGDRQITNETASRDFERRPQHLTAQHQNESLGAGSGPNILVINSYHQNYHWTAALLSGVETSLRSSKQAPAIYSEFMDTKQFNWGKNRQAFLSLVAQKYQAVDLDLVMTTGNAALNFALTEAGHLFRDVPIVFIGMKGYYPDLIADRPQVYGVNEKFDIRGTVEMMQLLHPEVRHLVVIADESEAGKQLHRQVKQLLDTLNLTLSVEYFTDWSFEDLGKRFVDLKKHEGVLATSFFNDNQGNYLSPEDLVPWLASKTQSPIYALWERDVRLGFSGGVVISGESTGKAAGHLALAVLQDKGDAIMGPEHRVMNSANRAMLNFENLWKMGLNPEKLAFDGDFINQPSSLYEKYKPLFIGLFIGLIVQTLLCVILLVNINRRKKVEKELERRANIDLLTGLLSRRNFEEKLSVSMQQARRRQDSVYFLFLDVDNFKILNDTYGHHVGDEMLICVAERLRKVVPSYAIVSRLSGDEFAVFFRALKITSFNLERLLNAIVNEFEQPVYLEDRKLHVHVSIGAAQFPDHSGSEAELMKSADSAMYAAKRKRSPRSEYCIFTRDIGVRSQRRSDIEQNFAKALANNEFRLCYQPIVNHLKQVVSCEALLRWNSEELGEVGPEEFISIAEKTGWIVPIGDWVLQQSIKDLTLFHGYNSNFGMSINTSYQQFLGGRILGVIDEIASELGWIPRNLCLEITERTLMQSGIDTDINAIIGKLNHRGISLAIDDFGTGYSSLSYLHQYDFDMVKIDRSFIAAMRLSKTNHALLIGIKSIADILNKELIVEGVEEASEYALLQEMQFKKFQGNFFFPSLSVEEMCCIITESKPQQSVTEEPSLVI